MSRQTLLTLTLLTSAISAFSQGPAPAREKGAPEPRAPHESPGHPDLFPVLDGRIGGGRVTRAGRAAPGAPFSRAGAGPWENALIADVRRVRVRRVWRDMAFLPRGSISQRAGVRRSRSQKTGDRSQEAARFSLNYRGRWWSRSRLVYLPLFGLPLRRGYEGSADGSFLRASERGTWGVRVRGPAPLRSCQRDPRIPSRRSR